TKLGDHTRSAVFGDVGILRMARHDPSEHSVARYIPDHACGRCGGCPTRAGVALPSRAVRGEAPLVQFTASRHSGRVRQVRPASIRKFRVLLFQVHTIRRRPTGLVTPHCRAPGVLLPRARCSLPGEPNPGGTDPVAHPVSGPTHPRSRSEWQVPATPPGIPGVTTNDGLVHNRS